MFRQRFPERLCMLLALSWCVVSCSKKGDFIDEGKVGNGVHYYPVIVSQALQDTITHKTLNLTDTTFSPGQQIIFELDFFTQDPPDSFELWAGKSLGHLAKALSIPYEAAAYSPTKFIDTILYQYRLPGSLDSASDWYIQPRVVTVNKLQSSLNAVMRIQ